MGEPPRFIVVVTSKKKYIVSLIVNIVHMCTKREKNLYVYILYNMFATRKQTL